MLEFLETFKWKFNGSYREFKKQTEIFLYFPLNYINCYFLLIVTAIQKILLSSKYLKAQRRKRGY